MKKLLIIVLVFVITLVLDEKYDILKTFVKDPVVITFIKGFGALLLAYLTPKQLGIANDLGGSNVPPSKDEK